MSRAWVTQPTKWLKRHGEADCPWAVEWYDPAGNRRLKGFGPGAKGKRLADRYCEQVTAELLTGTYGDRSKAGWAELVASYRELRFPHLDPESRRVTETSLAHFARVARVKKAAAVSAEVVARFTAARLAEPARNRGGTISPATVNKDLRHLKAVFRFGAEHGYMPAAPRVRFCKEPKRLPRVIEPDRFDALFAACEHARQPAGVPNVPPADWWRALFGFLYLTGWRITETMRLTWADVDLAGGHVITRAEHNKSDRDERVPLHPAAADLLRPLQGGFTAEVFAWPFGQRTLYKHFDKIQTAAGVVKPFYGFHDFRRSFATYNAEGLGAEMLKRMMRHTAYATTQRYIRMADDLSPVLGKLFVPASMRPNGAEDGRKGAGRGKKGAK